jgi:hypothetical protein
MTLSPQYSLLHSDLNDFLFASVGDEQSGMPLSVVSALTRLGIDPWEEAARLAILPKAVAAEALAPTIAVLPIGRSELSDNLATSRRLVELLPARGRAGSPGREQNRAKDQNRAMILVACLALGAAVLSAMW